MDSRERWGLVLCLAVAVVAVLSVGGVAGAVDDRSHSLQESGPETATAQEDFDADDVRLTVDVDGDGTASWTVEYWKRLDDDESEAAFESIESDVEENPEEYVDGFAESMDDTVASAAEDTGREMSASEYTVSTRTESIPQEYGVLTYQFEWSGFAAVDGDRMEIGDAISGFFLDDGTRLVVGWPSEYGLVDVRPEPGETRSDSVLWRGSETTFVGDEPGVVVSTNPDDADGISGDTGGEADTDVPLIPVGGGVTGVALLFMLWWLYSRGLSDEGVEGDDVAGRSDAGTETAGNAGAAVASEASTDEAGSDEAADASGDNAGDDGSSDATDEPDDGPPSELLSNEERVVKLLEQHDGRLKQQQVVKQLDWTDAKTSQVIGELREEGTVETFRIGRENVVRLPEADEDDII